jgi:hypothetical protein
MPVTALPPLPGEGSGPPDPGSGFGWGERWDRAEPGPLLIAAVEKVSRQDPGQLSADELAGLLLAHRRVASWVAAMNLAVLAELAARRCRAAASGDTRAGERTVAEVAAGLNLAPAAATRALEFATAMARLPATTAALRAGLTGRRRPRSPMSCAASVTPMPPLPTRRWRGRPPACAPGRCGLWRGSRCSPSTLLPPVSGGRRQRGGPA